MSEQIGQLKQGSYLKIFLMAYSLCLPVVKRELEAEAAALADRVNKATVEVCIT